MLMRTHPCMCFNVTGGKHVFGPFICFIDTSRIVCKVICLLLSKLMSLMLNTLKICTAQNHQTHKMTGFARILKITDHKVYWSITNYQTEIARS